MSFKYEPASEPLNTLIPLGVDMVPFMVSSGGARSGWVPRVDNLIPALLV